MSSKHNASNRIFWWVMVFSLLYSSYRYPLQINFSGTSPNYSDTPEILQMGKYLVLVCLVFISIIMEGGLHIKESQKSPSAFAMIMIAFYPLFKYFLDLENKHLSFSLFIFATFAFAIF